MEAGGIRAPRATATGRNESMRSVASKIPGRARRLTASDHHRLRGAAGPHPGQIAVDELFDETTRTFRALRRWYRCLHQLTVSIPQGRFTA